MSETKAMTKREAIFWAATNQEKAVMIAADVIKRLDSRKLEAETGDYISLYIFEAAKDEPLNKVLDSLEDACQVCALGGLFYCSIMLGDQIDTIDLLGEYNNYILASALKEDLLPIFGADQLSLIESAFEVYHIVTVDSIYKRYSPEISRALAFGRRYNSADERMRAIMSNIIRNKGIFKP